MFCKNCGNEIKDNQKFCPKCGESVQKSKGPIVDISSQMTQPLRPVSDSWSSQPVTPVANKKAPKKPKEKMSKGKKAKIICISIFAAIAVIFVSFVAVYFTSPAYSVYKNLKDVDCSSAISEYNSSVEDSFIQKIFIKIALNGYNEKILNEFKDGKIEFEDALSVLETMKEMNVENVDGAIDEINRLNAAKTAFDAADKYYADGDYESAIKEYSKITDADSQFADAQAKLAELYPKYSNTISEKAKQLSSSGDYAGALSLINTALGILPDGSAGKNELNQTKSECLDTYKKEVTEAAATMIAEKSYTEAIGFINKAIAVDDNEDFQNLKSTAEKEYINSVTATVNDFIKQEDYISAERNVKAALDILPNNSELIALQKTVTDATPTYLLDVCKPYFTSDGYQEYLNGETFMVGGTNMTNGFQLPSCEGKAVFNLDGKYKTIDFYLGHVANTQNGNAQIKIYLDDVLKSTYVLQYDDLSQKISIDVTGVKQLKIIVEAIDVNYGTYYIHYGFGNVVVK